MAYGAWFFGGVLVAILNTALDYPLHAEDGRQGWLRIVVWTGFVLLAIVTVLAHLIRATLQIWTVDHPDHANLGGVRFAVVYRWLGMEFRYPLDLSNEVVLVKQIQYGHKGTGGGWVMINRHLFYVADYLVASDRTHVSSRHSERPSSGEARIMDRAKELSRLTGMRLKTESGDRDPGWLSVLFMSDWKS